MQVLILAGTSDGNALATALAGHPVIRAQASLAGRTRTPGNLPVSHRVGGFGGAEGLATHLRADGIDALVDATHPFASGITANAAAAARQTGIPLAILRRPSWTPGPGDHWLPVPDLDTAADALQDLGHRVLVTTGRQGLAAFERTPDKHYVIRTIDPPEPPPALPDAVYLQARGPFRLADEQALMAGHGVEVLVSKASGGDATCAKLGAARALGIPVVMVERPPEPVGVPAFTDAAEVVRWLEGLRR
ncbi:cobalt-precorrin-6A reductase [Aquisalimonas asiatica]|uniref:Precorrin-6A/cobalt-precorrin-6A reductase n=1 Tax=Aquisalimonas asiatica TaxID=406100 RepID=A0A1H8U975_9GAMM|nr:cobalt-precorrin-6A reductase [Aquisalimonas asiatica]SEO99751.1 precorrin-6A/cobalt-precorrin-6A reductase [Aquisalimonas asiatica]